MAKKLLIAISILLPDLRGGGAERVNLDLAHEFARQGHDVEFVLMQARGEFLAEAQAAFAVTDLNTPRARQVPRALARYLRQRRPDALLAAMWPLTVLAPLARRLSGHRCRVVVSEHGILSAEYKDWGWMHRFALRISTALGYRLADARVTVSRGVADDLALLSGIARKSFTVIHNPISAPSEPDRQARDAAEQLWGAHRGPRILTVGSFKQVKNHALLLRAFARMEKPGNAHLMLLGKGALRDDMEALMAEAGLAGKVLMPGFFADPAPFYRSADLFVLSSDYEGFGNVIVEALAAGLPIVSTDCPSGPAEILMGGKFGTLVPVGDEVALAAAMEAALAQNHDPMRLRARARDFAPEVAVARYLELLGAPL